MTHTHSRKLDTGQVVEGFYLVMEISSQNESPFQSEASRSWS